MSTKDLPGRPKHHASEGLPFAVQASLDRPVPVLALPGFTLFPGTLTPLQAFEPEPCRALAEALADRRLLVLAALDEPGPERAFHRVAGLGRIVSDRRHGDQRIDVFVHGLARVRLEDVTLGACGLVAQIAVLPDVPERATAEAGLRLLAIATALQRVLMARDAEQAEALATIIRASSDVSLITDRIAAVFVEPFADRQALLGERCPAARADGVAEHLGSRLLKASHAPRDRTH